MTPTFPSQSKAFIPAWTEGAFTSISPSLIQPQRPRVYISLGTPSTLVNRTVYFGAIVDGMVQATFRWNLAIQFVLNQSIMLEKDVSLFEPLPFSGTPLPNMPVTPQMPAFRVDRRLAAAGNQWLWSLPTPENGHRVYQHYEDTTASWLYALTMPPSYWTVQCDRIDLFGQEVSDTPASVAGNGIVSFYLGVRSQ